MSIFPITCKSDLCTDYYFKLESAHKKNKFMGEKKRSGVEARQYFNAILRASDVSVFLSMLWGKGHLDTTTLEKDL